jgi:hypothetical protein
MATRKKATKKAASKKASRTPGKSAKTASSKKRRTSARRELINTGTDKRYVRRRADGTFKESDDVSRSLSADRRRKAKTKSKPGQGDRGDR